MNSTKTCSLSRLEPIWQDLLHQATQSLLAQRSLPELMRALHQLSFSAIRFDRVNILRLDPLHNRITLYRYDPQQDRVIQDGDVLLADGPGGGSGPNSARSAARALISALTSPPSPRCRTMPGLRPIASCR